MIVALGLAVLVAFGVGFGAAATGLGVGFGVGLGVALAGLAVGFGVGLGVGFGVGLGVGFGVGAVTVNDAGIDRREGAPAARRVRRARKAYEWTAGGCARRRCRPSYWAARS